jgi:uncharacterized protein
MKKRIVVDTSVLVSALISAHGPNREVLRRCLQGVNTPLISNALFQEYEAVSRRKNIRERCLLNDAEIKELLNAFYSVCQWVPVYFLLRPKLHDEGDNFLIELALAGAADIIITNNLKGLENSELKFPNLTIVTPNQFLEVAYGDANDQTPG